MYTFRRFSQCVILENDCLLIKAVRQVFLRLVHSITLYRGVKAKEDKKKEKKMRFESEEVDYVGEEKKKEILNNC